MKKLLFVLALIAAAPAAAQPVAMTKVQEADRNWTLTHELIVEAPIQQVWAAISTAEGWKSWAVPTAWSPEGRPDIIETSYTAGAKPDDPSTIRQEVLLRIPSRLMVFRTVKAPAGFPHFDTYARVTSAFELSPAGKRRTRVRLTGAGYADSDGGRMLLGFFEKGNAKSLEWLRNRFGKRPKEPPKR
jgi:uncharacterized protein YndB with AHSA1/START domain